MTSSVRVRLTALVTIIFGLFLSFGAFGLVRQVSNALINDIQVRNDNVSEMLKSLIASRQLSPEALTSEAQMLQAELNGQYDVGLVREGIQDSFIYVTGPPIGSTSESTNMLDFLKRMMPNSMTPLFGKVIPDDIAKDRYAVSQARIPTANGELILNVASPLDGINRTVHRITNALVIAVPALVALVGMLTWFITGRALHPVHSITTRANAIGGSNLHERVPVPKADDEIGELARTMNAMLDRLESSAAAQKRFMSDASHELRSPVASIRTQLETALLAKDQTDWERVAGTVLAEDQRLGSLVDNMLVMARIEEGMRPAVAEVDLDDVVFEQTSRPTAVAVDKSRVGAGRVVGVPNELGSVVRNLFDNAVRHAASKVTISLSTVGPWVRLAVEDDGPGVDPENRDKIFERFARLQEGRARDSGGSGLGLALVKQIVEGRGGRVFVETSDLGGAAFVVELPAAHHDSDE